jgi:hypothetical protein
MDLNSLVLHPLFGPCCVGEPLPGADSMAIEAALADNPGLKAAFELAPFASPGSNLDNGVAPPVQTPDYDYEPPTPRGFSPR